MTTTPTIAPPTEIQHARAGEVKVITPATGAVLTTVAIHGVEALDDHLDRARGVLTVWPRTRLADRQHSIHTFVTAARAAQDELAGTLAAETGISVRAARAQLVEALGYIHETVGASNAFYGQTYPHGAETITASFLQYTVHEPLGVIGVLMDERAPALSFAHQVSSSLLMGDVLVVAPAVLAPLTVLRMVELLHEAGIPEEALQVAVGTDAYRTAIAADGRLNGLSVHGTTEDAIAATSAARAHLTRVVAFGDSNDAFLVLDDADLDLVVEEAVRAGLVDSAGQGRTAPSRLVVHSAVREELTSRLVQRVRGLQLGDPAEEGVDVGPVASGEVGKTVREQIQRLCDAGAELLTGGGGSGAFVEPTVLHATGDAVALATRMVLRGPVLVLLEVESLEEGTDLIDASPYGIGTGIFTRDIERAGGAIQRLEIGIAVVNGAGDHRTHRTPLTGVRKSAVGAESLLETPLATTELKTILAADIYDYVAENHDNPVGRHS